MERPDIEAIRDYLARMSDCGRDDLQRVDELFAYIEQLEAERDGLASWLDTLRDLPDGMSLRDYREDAKKWGP
jgi:hypothetical protein